MFAYFISIRALGYEGSRSPPQFGVWIGVGLGIRILYEGGAKNILKIILCGRRPKV